MRIPIHVSSDSAEPLYSQIKEQLRALILSGHLKEGYLLPSNREFAADLACSVITIRRVYQDLEKEGLLRSRQGTGTFVAKVGSEELEQYRYKAVHDALQEAIELAYRVQCPPEEIRAIVEQLIQLLEKSKGEPK
ncbi:GntR family transcriptional regulator [Paenibacillus sp. J31TS4]|uniref:GntR family transcriptional regulator n=1 Tax=Paenibacillus sp. J31TS4 TaxID=2807195 RepID=UPI001AFF56EA|nr:GntR family transcriptional regulator [Paenibacillus sp. J31TS4]GIP41446.1 GntR family transcriptional regulator [Paenibacillus sp. J31TS4]